MVDIKLSGFAQQPSTAAAAREHTADGDGGKARADTPRTVNDTVELSRGGEKAVNLARGETLAADLKGRAVDESFARDLRSAFEDIFRITRLFTETIKSAFGRGR